jgi:hypothetical protein
VTRWFTSRKVITAVGFITATVMVYTGKMSDATWVYALAVLLAGHHAGDLISKWKGKSDVDAR